MRLRSVLSATALLATLTAVGPAAHAASAAQYITDDQGRVLVLHGLNTSGSAKGVTGLPWVTEADIATEEADLGSNSVRLLIQWKNIEPAPGVYDDTYLGQVAQRVGWYAEQGIHVILDMHQDIYGPATCDGDGAPPWATITDGKGCTPQSQWELDYLQPGTLNAFNNFWNYAGNHPELMAHYVDMWQHVAAYFAGNPAVLGYDLMNEPFGGARQLGFFEGPILTPFYQRIINAIRQVDQRGWIFAEPASVAANQGLPSGLRHLTDPRDGTPRLVYAPHLYPLALDLGGSYTGATRTGVKVEMALWQASQQATATRLGMPMWVGEFGAIPDPTYVTDSTDLFDGMDVGWSYWSNDQDPTGPFDNGETPIATALTRPYARAIAGLPTKMGLSGTTYTASWTGRTGVTAPTEVWLPPSYGTPTVFLSDGSYVFDAATRILSVTTPDSGSHTVRVSPAG